MAELNRLREELCTFAENLYRQGLTHGSTGNISARTTDGGLLVSPTGSSFLTLDPARLSHFDADMRQIDGAPPTKEVPLHQAFYDTRAGTGAVVHLHSCHAVALSMMPDVDPDDLIPPLTPYPVMLLGKVKLLPYITPGDTAIGDAIRALDGRHSAVVLANHGPVVAGKDLRTAVNAIEELEAGARLAMLTRGHQPNLLTENDLAELARRYDSGS